MTTTTLIKKQCHCFINHALTETHRTQVLEAIDRARGLGDMAQVPIMLAQLSVQDCPARPFVALAEQLRRSAAERAAAGTALANAGRDPLALTHSEDEGTIEAHADDCAGCGVLAEFLLERENARQAVTGSEG